MDIEKFRKILSDDDVNEEEKYRSCDCKRTIRCNLSYNLICKDCGRIVSMSDYMMPPSIGYLNQKGEIQHFSTGCTPSYPKSILGTRIQGFNTSLKRTHQWTSMNSEKSLKDKRNKIIQVCTQHNEPIPRKIVSLACDTYTKIHLFKNRDGIKRGRPLIGRMAACVQYAAQQYDFPLQEETIIDMFFINDKHKKGTKTYKNLIRQSKQYLRKGMTYLLDLKFYEDGQVDKNLLTDADKDLKTGIRRLNTIKMLIAEHCRNLGIDEAHAHIAIHVAMAINKTKRDKDKQNKTFVSTCIVLMNERYPIPGVTKRMIISECGSTSGAINTFQKAILTYLIKKFRIDTSVRRRFNAKSSLFDTLFPVQDFPMKNNS